MVASPNWSSIAYAELKANRWHAAEIVILALAVIYSAIQTGISSKAIVATKKLAGDQANFDMRNDALKQFVESDLSFDTNFRQITNRIQVDVEEPKAVIGMSRAQFAQLREIVDPIIKVRNDQTIVFRSTILSWPKSIRDMYVEYGRLGDIVANCYSAATRNALSEDEFNDTKRQINEKCSHLATNYEKYRKLSDMVYGDMANEVLNAAVVLGADPLHEIPDSVRGAPYK